MDAAGPARLSLAEATRLRQAGVRVTRPRLAVYRALRELGGHRTADEVTDHLSARGETLPRTSVYNCLAVLRDAGLVMTAGIGPGAALYEAAADWHHHFVCRRCGTVVDVPCVIGTKPCLEAQVAGATLDEAQIVFRGLCAACGPDERKVSP